MTEEMTVGELQDKIEELENKLAEAKKTFREFKAHGYKVAMAAKQRYGWCAEYDALVREAGLMPSYTNIGVEMTIPVVATLRVNQEAWEEMSTEEKQELIRENAKLAGDLRSTSALIETGTVASGDGEIVVGTITNRANTRAGVTYGGYDWKYSSENGRVRHLFPTRDRGRYASSLCGQITYARFNELLDTSPRGENRNCASCTRAASR